MVWVEVFENKLKKKRAHIWKIGLGGILYRLTFNLIWPCV